MLLSLRSRKNARCRLCEWKWSMMTALCEKLPRWKCVFNILTHYIPDVNWVCWKRTMPRINIFRFSYSYSWKMFCSYQCTLTDQRHFCNLSVCLPLFQKIQSQPNLLRGVFLLSAVPEIGILSGNCLSCLRPLHDHPPFVFPKGRHDSENQIARQNPCYREGRPRKFTSCQLNHGLQLLKTEIAAHRSKLWPVSAKVPCFVQSDKNAPAFHTGWSIYSFKTLNHHLECK